MRKATQFIFLLSMFAPALSCSVPSTDAPPAPSAQTPAPPVDRPKKPSPRIAVHDLEKKIHDRVNKERLKRGLPTMRWDDALGSIAGKHSKDMSAKQYFGHTSPDGHDQSYRYLKSGYACGVTVDGVLRRGAENIYRFSPGADDNPEEVIIRGWLENQDDRRNLLSSPWDREGIGVYVGPDGVLYVTMNFC